VVKQGLEESDALKTNFENFMRGHKFEKEVISVFCHLSNSKTETCGFFEDPSNSNYGTSPDALAASPFILEVKTRPAKTEGPLSSLKTDAKLLHPASVRNGVYWCPLLYFRIISPLNTTSIIFPCQDRQCFNVSYKGYHKQYFR